LAGLTVRGVGRDNDGGGQKCTEDYGGSIAGVDEMRARFTVGGGERGRKKKRARHRGQLLLKRRWAR
jgi:hypothetical protein